MSRQGGTGTEVSVKINCDEEENVGYEKSPLAYVATVDKSIVLRDQYRRKIGGKEEEA